MNQPDQLFIDQLKQQFQQEHIEIVPGDGIIVRRNKNQIIISAQKPQQQVLPISICVNGVSRKINFITQGRDFSPDFPVTLHGG
jgi:hypothetical protein